MLTDNWRHIGAVESKYWIPVSLWLRKGVALYKRVTLISLSLGVLIWKMGMTFIS